MLKDEQKSAQKYFSQFVIAYLQTEFGKSEGEHEGHSPFLQLYKAATVTKSIAALPRPRSSLRNANVNMMVASWGSVNPLLQSTFCKI